MKLILTEERPENWYLKSWRVSVGEFDTLGFIKKQRVDDYKPLTAYSAMLKGKKTFYRIEYRGLAIFPQGWNVKGGHVIGTNYYKTLKEAKKAFRIQTKKQIKYLKKLINNVE